MMELLVYVLNPCGLAKVFKKIYCQISRTQEQIKPVKENLFIIQMHKQTPQETCQGKPACLYGA